MNLRTLLAIDPSSYLVEVEGRNVITESLMWMICDLDDVTERGIDCIGNLERGAKQAKQP